MCRYAVIKQHLLAKTGMPAANEKVVLLEFVAKHYIVRVPVSWKILVISLLFTGLVGIMVAIEVLRRFFAAGMYDETLNIRNYVPDVIFAFEPFNLGSALTPTSLGGANSMNAGPSA
jgi:hypothetical protein